MRHSDDVNVALHDEVDDRQRVARHEGPPDVGLAGIEREAKRSLLDAPNGLSEPREDALQGFWPAGAVPGAEEAYFVDGFALVE